ncbi:class I SAM-dependent methyltransferase [Amycolatopsis sp. H20-H5]|uniref:class I SAM-dependent methyltransferase n=1 Tax=Amycolatopsis sp. H20-H5 TaxID=3046309 RepID=UPI002DBDF174|nr:class I SAM-dependent methyltransferase [Amycolatopsis sp. H20-H5]MEC3978974.1 class I SAM-dependent methyltransferase [Amycolatopsis sp. H20-H5]
MAAHAHDGIDWGERLRWLQLAEALDADALSLAALRLAAELPDSPTIVDVGCGTGGMSVLLARELVGRAGGRIVLVDVTEPLLAEARRAVEAAAGGVVTVETVHADVSDPALPGRVPMADLLWASSMVHHLPDQQAALGTLAEMVRPGGMVAIAEGGLETQGLPWDLGLGRPGLERRLLTAQAEWFAGMRAGITDSVSMPYGWNTAMRQAGLTGVTSFGVLIDHPAPGDDQVREYVVQLVRRVAETAGEWLAADDQEVLAALLDPDGAHYLGARTDLFLLGARTIHHGRQP